MSAELIKIDKNDPDQEAIRRAGEIILAGGLVAFPTETVYGLGGNALDPHASEKIYAAKGRPSDNPLIVHIADLAHLTPLVREIPPSATALSERFWPGPLTMIFEKSPIVPYETTGGLDTVAVRFPSEPVAAALIRAAGGYVAAPSANTSGRPSPTTAQHVAEDLGDAIDMILDDGPVGIGLESTIVDFTQDPPCVLRPGYISLTDLEEVLGLCSMDPGLTGENAQVHPKAPGMKYRHYAPKALMTIVEGDRDAVISRINRLAAQAKAEGKRTRILACEENAGFYPPELCVCAGSRAREETIARHLYEKLREFDELGTDVIFSEAFDTPRLGTAIMNRLVKAAGHRVIHADGSDMAEKDTV
ncbi:MAG: threonylcarbamoyl-AMP synthase [Blautia sp.]|nr:threonylcarbamoyl-AMP synthase [Blautia sp.]